MVSVWEKAGSARGPKGWEQGELPKLDTSIHFCSSYSPGLWFQQSQPIWKKNGRHQTIKIDQTSAICTRFLWKPIDLSARGELKLIPLKYGTSSPWRNWGKETPCLPRLIPQEKRVHWEFSSAQIYPEHGYGNREAQAALQRALKGLKPRQNDSSHRNEGYAAASDSRTVKATHEMWGGTTNSGSDKGLVPRIYREIFQLGHLKKKNHQ